MKVGGTTKYLGLAAGPKSGELNVKLNGQVYVVQSIKPVELCNPVKIMGQPFTRAQSDADGYDWTSDPENNSPLCTTYGVAGAAYRPDEWGGQGAFRMWAIDPSTGGAYLYHPYAQIADAPYYFLYGDNNLTLLDAGSRNGAITICDVLKNGQSTLQEKNSGDPVLFDAGDTMTAIICFTGYNTRSDFQPVCTWYPIVRFADSIPASAYSPTIPAGLTTYNDIWQAMQTAGLATEVFTSSGISHYLVGATWNHMARTIQNRSNDKSYDFSHLSSLGQTNILIEDVEYLAVDNSGYLYVRTHDRKKIINHWYKGYAITKLSYSSSGYSKVAKYKNYTGW